MKTHLYRHFDADGELLYVGISLSTLNRLGQHKENSHWFDSISRVEIQKFDTREEALKAETLAIRSEKPKHNIRKKFLSQKDTVSNSEFSRNQLTSRIVQFNIVYSHQEIGKILGIGTYAVKKLIQEGKLGSITLPPRKEGLSVHGTPYKPIEVVSGWQLISYLETLHKGVF